MKNMSNYFDAEKPFDEVTKRDIEAMVIEKASCYLLCFSL